MEDNKETINELISELKKGISGFQANLSKLEKLVKESQKNNKEDVKKDLEVPEVELPVLEKPIETVLESIPTEEVIEKSSELEMPKIEESVVENSEENVSNKIEVSEEAPMELPQETEEPELEMPKVEEPVLENPVGDNVNVPIESIKTPVIEGNHEIREFKRLDIAILSHIKDYFKQNWPEVIENTKNQSQVVTAEKNEDVLQPTLNEEIKPDVPEETHVTEESYDLKMPEIEETKLYTPESFTEETPSNPGDIVESVTEEPNKEIPVSDFPEEEVNFNFDEIFEKMKNEGKGI